MFKKSGNYKKIQLECRYKNKMKFMMQLILFYSLLVIEFYDVVYFSFY